ncbi:MAG: NADH-quinone oxidoreductase subunit NuoF [Desulfomonile tiedjei]|uniref:NADH-quinone oxidoreductase subunit F n=1 Tax=Desulfomonile tiedjei TaxID=2358 RepID=A0A9D6UZB0_9BACT|nr:NADH-quinone oxidoreductase subunit NuoF [Desulfomonile tiedjei]
MEKPLTANFRPGEPLSLKEYEKLGGYQALRTALKMGPDEIIQLISQSNLRGRGGAGFPTGTKWSAVPSPKDLPGTRYFIADADEMEPGTFKDRLLMEGDPHQFLEGVIIGSYAIHAEEAFIFLRWEYTLAQSRLKSAISEAYSRGYLGNDIMGTGVNVRVHLHVSAGRYICGEGTALVNSLEGKRAVPHSKVPRQTDCGLWGRPTLMNNVETLCNVPHIINNGPEWFKNLSNSKDGGTKIYAVSGKVKRPGAWELPMGTTIREILEENAGGMRDGLKFRGVMPGGASTDFLVEQHLDVKMDYDSVQKAGSRLGTGTMIVLDDQTCPVGMVHNLEHFFARESCGWCTPCREGLPWVASILKAMEEGHGQPDDLDVLRFHTKHLGPGRTYCALAPGAMEPLQSALVYFREDFERHITEKRCPWR